MNIYLLNILFAVVGVAIAVVPLLVGMKHQSRRHTDEVAPTHAEVFGRSEAERRLDTVV